MRNMIINVVLLLLFSLLIFSNSKAAGHNVDQQPWLQNVCQGKESVSKLHFYIQDVLSGPNATVWEVSRSSITETSPTSFGLVRVVDDLITSGPDSSSKSLGRLQGFITSSDLEVSALAINLNFVFSLGKYNGSTLSIVGRDPIKGENREMPIVGGTGVFRMARGYATVDTYSYDSVKDYVVLEYTLYVTTYVDKWSGHIVATS